MSKQEEHNRSLHDLLKKENRQEPEDPFEKEAREGFEMLEDHGQAFELKAATDARVNKELFAPRRERTIFYWAAAASVLLFVGFAVYFFNDFSGDDQTFAVKNTETKKEVETLPSQPKIVAAPAETKPEKQEEKGSIRSGSDKKTKADTRSFETEEPSVSNTENKLAEKDQKVVSSEALQMAAATSEPAKKEEEFVVSPTRDDDLSAGKNAGAGNQNTTAKKAKKAEQPPAASPARAQSDYMEADVSVHATYPGGQQELLKELSEKLRKRNTLVEFAATLFIKDDGSVEKVEFLQDDALSKQQKKVIKEEILSLKKFQVSSNDSPATYELKFKP